MGYNYLKTAQKRRICVRNAGKTAKRAQKRLICVRTQGKPQNGHKNTEFVSERGGKNKNAGKTSALQGGTANSKVVKPNLFIPHISFKVEF